MEDERFLAAERHQIEQIRELDFEELQVEEVDDDSSDDDHDASGAAQSGGELTFNTCLASMHTYLGEVEDTHHRLAFLEGGAVLTLPLFYLEGVVLFPEATLPLRVIQPNFISSVERALVQLDAQYTLGVVRVCRDSDNTRLRFATVGTTAEIRQYRRLEDGSLNVVTRGQQRFRLRRRWIDAGGAPCGEVQIIKEDLPIRAPKDAFGNLGPLRHLRGHSLSCLPGPSASSRRYGDDGDDTESNSEDSFESELSTAKRRVHQSAMYSSSGCDLMDDSISSDDEKCPISTEIKFRSHLSDSDSIGSLPSDREEKSKNATCEVGDSSASGMKFGKGLGAKRVRESTDLSQFRKVPRAFWPHWVYQMYDSYCLAERAADMWRQIVGTPSMDGFVRKPDLLSFYIGSKIPVSESTRQELLEIDGVSYRLRREIELLQNFDLIRCKKCRTVIAKRSDMLVMSSDGPLSAYVNPSGFVHEVMTLYKATGLALKGRAFTEYSWFPGYAWTVTDCVNCETQLGWLFTATKKKLKPQSFWGIRSSMVADDMR